MQEGGSKSVDRAFCAGAGWMRAGRIMGKGATGSSGRRGWVRISEGALFAGMNRQTAVDGGAKSVTERADQH